MSIEKILIATGNKGKFTEISSLLSGVGIDTIGTFDYDLEEPVEDGIDFEENSLIKAKYYAQKTGLIALADDSGLCIEALGGQPGIHSARFAQDETTGKKDFNLAFDKIKQELLQVGVNMSTDKVPAHFICNLTIYNPISNQHHSFEGRVDGNLTYPSRGDSGFGYDPIFISNIFGKTFAQVSNEQKEKVSHRADAFSKFNNFLKSNAFKSFLGSIKDSSAA
jgi:XTP/dITP diphosphohydrolase